MLAKRLIEPSALRTPGAWANALLVATFDTFGSITGPATPTQSTTAATLPCMYRSWTTKMSIWPVLATGGAHFSRSRYCSIALTAIGELTTPVAGLVLVSSQMSPPYSQTIVFTCMDEKS